jgi:hypothetical protein
MIGAGLIRKDKGDRLRWVIEDKGLFILKHRATGSVNSFTNYQTKPIKRLIPIRLDNLSFAFKVISSLEQPLSDDQPHWIKMNNGVSKCCLPFDTHTVELVKSEKGEGSALYIHLKKKYCYDCTKELINQYNLALHHAKQAAIKFRIEISEYGRMDKRPHFAFEEDLIAHFIATSHTAEIKTGDANEPENDRYEDYKAWIDSSSGSGEFETNDYGYAYRYLMMPKKVDEIEGQLKRIINFAGYHPLYTGNN